MVQWRWPKTRDVVYGNREHNTAHTDRFVAWKE